MTTRGASVLLIGMLLLPACDVVEPVDPAREVPIEELLDGEITVEPNPSGVAPLTARIRLDTSTPTTLTLTVLGVGGTEAIERRSGESATSHTASLLGLLPGVQNQVEVLLAASETYALDTIAITTDPLPDFFPEIEVTTSVPELMEPGWTLADLLIGRDDGLNPYPLIFDGTGTVRWYLDLSGIGGNGLPFERLENGRWAATFDGHVIELDMFGNRVREWILAPTYTTHHDIVEKPDGNLIVAANKLELETIEDHVIELNRESGTVVREWDLRQVLDVRRTAFIDNPRDWLHVNSVWYDESDGGLIISARHQGVFKVSADNELVWILAPHRGWGPAGPDQQGHDTSEFLLTAVDADGVSYPAAVQDGAERTADFDWSWGQHAAMILPNRNLLLFDNGDNRHFSDASPDYSRAVEYEIDPSAMTVRQVWAYGRDRGDSYFASFVSDVDHLHETGNRLVIPGIVRTLDPHRGYITEVASGGSVVFEAVLRYTNTEGAFPDLIYRAERLPLHPN